MKTEMIDKETRRQGDKERGTQGAIDDANESLSPSLPLSPSPPLLFRLLVIAYGNPLRGDDGAGIALAEQVVTCWRAQGYEVNLIEVQQLTPELVLQIAEPNVDAVFFFDGIQPTNNGSTNNSPERNSPDSTNEIQIHSVDSQIGHASLGHYMAPITLIEYARALYHQSLPAWLVTVPGVDFEHGSQLSWRTTHLLKSAPLVAQELLKKSRLTTEKSAY